MGDGDRPITWWGCLLAPWIWIIALPLMLIVAVLLIPYVLVYPERRAHINDFGTDREREFMRRYRRYAARVSFWRRSGRVLAFPFRWRRSHLPRNRPPNLAPDAPLDYGPSETSP